MRLEVLRSLISCVVGRLLRRLQLGLVADEQLLTLGARLAGALGAVVRDDRLYHLHGSHWIGIAISNLKEVIAHRIHLNLGRDYCVESVLQACSVRGGNADILRKISSIGNRKGEAPALQKLGKRCSLSFRWSRRQVGLWSSSSENLIPMQRPEASDRLILAGQFPG